MKITADENIAYVKEVFSPLGDVLTFSGRSLTRAQLQNADVLLVRSVTRVNADLLEGTPVRFVGTSTIGTDHIDLDYLRRRNIAFACAAGANANSVAEYVLTAICHIAQQHNINLANKTIGIIGVGNIGSIIEKKAPALGLRVLPNDPPLQRRTNDPRFVSLGDALQADIITLHVPLTHDGPDPTFHLLNENSLSYLKPYTILINTSRGAVIDNLALKNSLAAGKLGPAVLDVWENEPNIDPELLKLTTLGTAHIAGYSLDGKANGVAQLHNALGKFLNQKHQINIASFLPAPPVAHLTLDATRPAQQVLHRVLTAIYDIQRDDQALRQILNQSPGRHASIFDHLRKTYPIRREAQNTRITLSPANSLLAKKLAILDLQLNQ